MALAPPVVPFILQDNEDVSIATGLVARQLSLSLDEASKIEQALRGIFVHTIGTLRLLVSDSYEWSQVLSIPPPREGSAEASCHVF